MVRRRLAVLLALIFALFSCVPVPTAQPKRTASAFAAATMASPIVWHVVTRPPVAIPATTKQFWISSTGSDANPGTLASPKSFEFMRLCQSCSDTTIWVMPGDGGGYVRTADGGMNTNLYGAGLPGKPLIVRAAPGATLADMPVWRVNANQWWGGYTLSGHDVWYVGIRFTPALGSNADRITAAVGSTPGNDQSHYGQGLFLRNDQPGDGQKVINCVLDNNLQGIAPQTTTAPGFEMNGCLVYYNGWFSSDPADRSHGHGVYPQPGCTGLPHKYTDLIIERNFNSGMHAYGSASTCGNDTVYDGIIADGNGDLPFPPPGGGGGYQMILAHASVDKNFKILNPVIYVPGTGAGNNLHIGYASWPATPSITGGLVSGGLIAGGLWLERVKVPDGITVSNVAFRGPPEPTFSGYVQADYPTNDWNTASGHGYIFTNAYEPGRANVAIWNKAGDATVALNLADAGVQVGAPYEIRYSMNFFGPPLTGVYQGGTIDLPMTGWAMATVDGNIATPSSYLPTFGAFVVKQTGGVSSTPTATATPQPSSTPTPIPPTAIPPTATATAVPPTFTPSSTPTPPASSTPTPSSTSLPPSATPTPTPTSTATSSPTPTTTSSPIPPSATAKPSSSPVPPTASSTVTPSATPSATQTMTRTWTKTATRTKTQTPQTVCVTVTPICVKVTVTRSPTP